MVIELSWTVVSQAASWTEQAVSAARDKRQQRFAHVVGNAGTVVAGLRHVDRQTHALFTPLLHFFPPAWTQERRVEWVEAATRLAYEDEVLPRLRAAIRALRSQTVFIDDRQLSDIIDQIMVLAERTCRDVVAPMREDVLLENVWDSLGPGEGTQLLLPQLISLLGEDPVRVEEVKRLANTFLMDAAHHLRFITNELEVTFGDLLGLQQREYPSLPSPDWVWA